MRIPFLVGLVASLPLLVHAQTTSTPGEDTSSNAQSFVPADFEQYAPRTALDMVSQIPGFSISGSDGSRGFGQASQNVLINGQRISSKSTSAQDALSRIPATNVEKIEIVDGASLDIPGLSGQVANVTAKADGISGTWTYRQRFRENLPPAFEWFELSVNGQNGTLGWTIGLEAEPGRGTSTGREDITDGAGNLLEYREESDTFIGDFVGMNGSINWKPTNGHIANLSAEYNLSEPDDRETSSVFRPDGALLRQTVFQFKENEWNSEISGDYEFSVGPGRLKFIGLQRNEHSPTRAKFYGADLDGSNISDDIFDRTVDESESILRGEYSWSNADNSDWQVSLEGALNTLESEAKLFEGSVFGTLTPIDIGDPTIEVEEQRIEAFVTHGRQLNKDLRLQVSIGAEQSEIMSDGVNGQTRTFTRPKGSASLAWKANDDLTINTKLERRIGQLNFFDFVSNVDLNQGDNQTGNVDIVPEQSWRLEVEAEQDFGTWGAVTATVFGESIEDIGDQVPIGTGEGPGNLDNASRIGASIEGTLKLDNFGWKGAQIEYNGDIQDSKVDDPITGETRRINDDHIYEFRIDFRHDIENTDWAWGGFYRQHVDAPFYRRGIRTNFEQPQGFSAGFIEHKDLWGMTGTVFLANLLDSDNDFQRIRYSPDRNGTIDRIESRSRNFGSILTLRLKGSF
jgi:hypothetical protein